MPAYKKYEASYRQVEWFGKELIHLEPTWLFVNSQTKSKVEHAYQLSYNNEKQHPVHKEPCLYKNKHMRIIQIAEQYWRWAYIDILHADLLPEKPS